jgi:hypothetical protein
VSARKRRMVPGAIQGEGAIGEGGLRGVSKVSRLEPMEALALPGPEPEPETVVGELVPVSRKAGSHHGEPDPVPVELVRAELWDRLRGESRQAFEAFQEYRDEGPGRSLARAAQALGKAKATLEPWSKRWHWRARVLAHDDALDRDRQLALRAQSLELAGVRMRTERAVLEVVSPELGKHLRSREDAGYSGMSPTEAAKLLTATAQVAKVNGGSSPAVRVGTIEQAVFAVAERSRDPRRATD